VTSGTEIEPAYARTLTDRIKVAVEGTWHLIIEAYVTRAWAALGYPSWDDYCTREFGTSRLRLPREERQEIVSSLREQGLSLRAIAAATGVDKKTVQNTIAATGDFSPVARDPRDEILTQEDGEALTDDLPQPTRPATIIGIDVDLPQQTRPTIIGVNGKTYSASRTASPPDPYAQWTAEERDLLARWHSGETVVVNMRSDAHARFWALAEQGGYAVRVDRKSIWGNPFLTPDDGDRDQVCDNYADLYWPAKPSLHNQIQELRGKALGCWCAPARCHADYLKEMTVNA
jgi:hypothetical protein